MKLAIFGATGKTGTIFTKLAFENGFQVKVLVRDISKVKIRKEKFEIIQGNILNIEDVKKTITGCDAVISLIGHRPNTPENFHLNAIKNIISAMKELKIKRLISLTGSGVLASGDKPRFIDNLLTLAVKMLPHKTFEDGLNHANEIKKSGLDWTIVRANVLTLSPGKGSYKLGYLGKGIKIFLPREDLSKAILEILEDKNYYQKMPLVSAV